ncbi:MAG: hypothetical protein ACD_43C00125G0003 [uncultured bacterium]|nr:MAG: hypothetical protein ACD_43C00125G0003 [uncultured bacterium]
MKRFIDDELNAHLLDLADDLVAQGMKPADAMAAAQHQFGDTATIRRDLIALHPIRSGLLMPIMFGLLLALVLPFYFLHNNFPEQYIGLMSERVILWWWYFFITLAVAALANWLMEFYGLQQRTSLYNVLGFALAANIIITLVLDINNFEVNLHAIVFTFFCAALLNWLWVKLSINWKKRLLIIVTVVIIISALREQPLFQFALQDSCLFIAPDKSPLVGALKNCVQIAWWHPLLYPIYATLLASTIILLHHGFLLWRNTGTAWWRKFIISGAFALLPITPLVYHDINHYGELDIVPWKLEINQAYIHILGRSPEEKDYDFYAQTRSYQHMSRVREVLRASAERRIKISTIYKKIIGREPNTEIVESYATSPKSIKTIRHELKKQQTILTP